MTVCVPVMLSPRGQAVLEAKILSSASALVSKICPRPQTRPRAFVLGLSSTFLFWPRENVCNAGIGNFDSQLPIPYSIVMSVGNFVHYRITATPQIPDCLCHQ